METIDIKFTGTSPLLMHSDRLANPLDPATKAHSKLTSKKNKTEDDHYEIARSEWQGGLYFDEKLGPYLPGDNLRSCLVEGAKLNKKGPEVQQGTIMMANKLRLEYPGPRTVEGLWGDSRFRDARSVVISGRSRLMRYRPVFPDWSVTFTLGYDPEKIDAEKIVFFAENAGRFIGIGDFRPKKGGTFGRFEVEAL